MEDALFEPSHLRDTPWIQTQKNWKFGQKLTAMRDSKQMSHTIQAAFFEFVDGLSITKKGDSKGLSAYDVSVYFGIMALSEQTHGYLFVFIPLVYGKEITGQIMKLARSWNLLARSGFHM